MECKVAFDKGQSFSDYLMLFSNTRVYLIRRTDQCTECKACECEQCKQQSEQSHLCFGAPQIEKQFNLSGIEKVTQFRGLKTVFLMTL